MEKKNLSLKRRFIKKETFTEVTKNEISLFNSIINKYRSNFKNKLKYNKEKKESNFSGNFRIISVLKDGKIITLSTEKLNDFLNFIKCFNCLFYVENGIRHYLINPETIEQYFEKSYYHILYDLVFSNKFDEKIFILQHLIPRRRNIKTIEDFCIFPQWYFDTINHDYIYDTVIWSPYRVLKFNRLNDKNYGNFMNRKFNKCSNSRITKFYGPLGTGKTTLVYVFFKTISFIQNLINSDDVTNYEIKKNKINLKDLNLSKKAKIKIKKYQNNVQNYIEVNNNLNLSYSSFEESSIDSNKQNNLINLDEIEEKEILYRRKESKENIEIKQSISPYYDKEYEGNDSTEEEYNFLSSFYVNLEKERTEDLSRANQKYVEYELINLFKTYKFYQYIISYLNSNKKNNIFDRIKLVIDFMKEINNKRNYFIIIDHISEKDQKDIINLEDYAIKDEYCYIIEIPLIKTTQEKINFLKDYYLNQDENLENYNKKDNISFIKRNKKYGIVYSTNFYSPKFSNNNEDVLFQENFGKNIYFYCLWKYSYQEMNINEFIEQIFDELCSIFKENYNNDKNKLSFNIKTILDVIEEKKEIIDKDFLAHLPLDYFVLINKNNKYILDYSFPLIKKVLQKLNVSSSFELIKSRYFIGYFDNYVKGGIMEDVFAKKMEQNYNNLIPINIYRILDNNIRDYYEYDEEYNFLQRNIRFMSIKKENSNLKYKNILFNQSQNAKHFNIGIKIFNNGNKYGFFQVVFHKSNNDIMDLINNLWIDLNYGINKINILCDEKNEKIEGIYIYFVLMDLESYCLKNITNKEFQIIDDNKIYNENLIKKLKEYNIDYLFLDNQGNIKKDGKIIKEIPFKLNLVNKFTKKIKYLNYQKEELEEKYIDYFQKIYPKNKIDILYFNPIINQKLKENRILVHLFKDINDNYFMINEGNKINYYNMNKMNVSENRVDEIEKCNKKNWKMNIYFKLH